MLDLEVRSAYVPRLFLDVTVRHCVPGDAGRLARAADNDGAVNKEAEADKRSRYPAGQAPWPVTPLALETHGRHGQAALLYLRKLAKKQAQLLNGDDAKALASSLVLRWGCRLSVALHRANAANLRRSLGASEEALKLRSLGWAAEIAA